MNEEDAKDLSYLIVIVAGMFLAVKFWNTRGSQWVSEHLGMVKGHESGVNLIGLGVLLVPLVALVLVARYKRRARRARKELEKRRAESVTTRQRDSWEW